MRLSSLRAAIVSVALLSAARADAQTTGQTVVVTESAPVFLLPDSTREPLRVAKEGSVLRLLGTEADWYRVQFQDPQFGRREGYLQMRFGRLVQPDRLQPTDLSVRERVAGPPASAPPVEGGERRPPAAVADPVASTSIRSKPLREGFWFNAGLGFGTLGCDNCLGRTNGLSGGLSLGGTLSDRVLLGVGTTGWYREESGVALSVGTLDARLRFYPSARSGFFITGGLGVGTISVLGDNETGVGAILGLGVDLRVGRNVSVTPFWNGFAMRSTVVDANVGQLGLGITVH